MIGRRIAHFTVLEKLGEGGMGVVYKARDNHLDRIVALKVLPPARVSDPERRRRFVREAKAASALNHPNIVTIYDIDTADDVTFIAMEYVQGRTLDRVIRGKGVPGPENLKQAVQIADALAAAHAAGIVHRDIKPANIMVTDAGHVKVLDFGLAKLTEVVEAATDGTTRTLEAPSTEEGAIVGTIAYMSPEQAEGKKVDARSDIFSFGSVLYEMTTGRRAFSGETKASTLAAILREDPKPASEMGLDVPREMEKIISRCLRKDPSRRYQHIADVKLALEELKEDSDSGKLTAVVPAARKRGRLLVGLAGGAVLVAAAILAWSLREPAPPGDLKAVPLMSSTAELGMPSLSPDGNKVAFVWGTEKQDQNDIYIKQIGSTGPPMRLTGQSAQYRYPSWSPDDRWIAFLSWRQNKAALMLIPPLGGPERALLETTAIMGLSWTPDGKWLAYAGQESADSPYSIWAVSVANGERRRLTTSQGSPSREWPPGDYYPSSSPDGRTLAFGRKVRPYLWEVYAQKFTSDLRPNGEPTKVTGRRYPTCVGITWAANGREVVYAAGDLYGPVLWRVPVSGRGAPQQLPFASKGARFPAVGRTQRRLVYASRVIKQNLWRLDTRSGERRMVAGSSYTSERSRFSPDGRKIVYQSDRSGSVEVWTCDADGKNSIQLTNFGGPQSGSPSWSPDGRWLALDSSAEGQFEIYVIAADGGTPRRLTNHPADDFLSRWSRDGRWIYFSSNRSGRFEIWKVPAGGGEAVQVTRSGGILAFESPDGKYLYYTKDGGPVAQPLFRMPVAGGQEEVVLPADRVSPNLVLSEFAVTTKGIYFFAPGGKAIQLLETTTGKIRTLATLDAEGFDLTVSEDDRYVMWTQTGDRTNDILLVENFR